jgi:hypothetical protein
MTVIGLSALTFAIAAARQAKRRGAEAGAVATARARCQRQLALAPRDPDALESNAELHRWQAVWALDERRRQEEIARGLDLARRALAQNPQSVEAPATIGELLVMRSRGEPDAERRLSLGEAQRSFQRTFEINPNLRRLHQAAFLEAASLND